MGVNGKIRIGTIGTGKIVRRFLAGIAKCPLIEYQAVYSRSEEKAKDFQKFCTAWLSFGKTSISRAINRRPDWGTGLAYNRPLPGKESPKGAKRPPREAPRAASSCLLIYWASYWYWR